MVRPGHPWDAIGAMAGILGVVVALYFGVQALPSDGSPGGGSSPDSTHSTTAEPESSPDEPGSGPRLTVSPAVVQPGQRFLISGSGFAPFAAVTVNMGPYFLTFEQADSSGVIEKSYGPIDQSYCSASPVELTAVVRNELAATTTVRFCT